MNNCVFCQSMSERLVLQNELAIAIWDAFPVTPMHCLVIPRRHISDYFELSSDELLACDALLREMHDHLRSEDASIRGFNVGTNVGDVAGQTIFHCHIHLIPRRLGDVENPRGGVRHVIPGKGAY